MQYEPQLDRDALVDLAINRYFGSVDKKDLEATLDCFNDGALLCTQTSFARHAGKEQIRRMFVDLFKEWKTLEHKDFVCTVDELNGRITASFIAQLADAKGNVTVLRNTNFWRVRDKKFQEVYVYMSGANVLV